MRLETHAERILYCTVRIQTEGPEPGQTGAGTAFIFGLADEKGPPIPFLVTNKHVVDGAFKGHFFFTAKEGSKPVVGERIDIEMDDFEARWYKHPDATVDIAAMPLAPIMRRVEEQTKPIFWSYLDQNLIPTEEQLSELDIFEDVVFVGYPNGIYDTVNLLPVFRRGTTATPLQIDYEGQPIFLIDASVFPGSSGSPVFIYDLAYYQTRRGLRTGSRVFFLGVLTQVAYRQVEGTLEFASIPTALVPVVKTEEMLDLGIVLKATTVLETVEGLLPILGVSRH